LGLIWDIDQVPSRNFNWLPFTPTLVTLSGPSGVYVDDLVVIGSSNEGIKHFKIEMAKAFRMSDLGLLHYYLGIEVR
jgi:hypothetical protein